MSRKIEYDYIIVGGGPTGITLATMLVETASKTLLIESESSLGGNWKIDWAEGQYLTEHSPKVLLSSNHYFFDLLKTIKVTNLGLKKVYGNFGNIKVLSTMMRMVSLTDVYKLTKMVASYYLNPTPFDYHQSLKEWVDKNAISRKGVRFLQTMTIVASNTYDKVCIGALVEYLTIDPGLFFDLVQLKDPEDWIRKATDHLSSYDNITIRYDTRVTSVHEKGTVYTSSGNYKGHKIILATPVRATFSIVKQSSGALQKNWFSTMDEFEHFVDRSTYTGIGIQFHFDERVPFSNEWCWSCFNEWSIIVINKEVTTKVVSKDPKVKSVWSCVIVDLDTKSTRLQKTANECDTMDEIIDEVLHQLRRANGKEFGRPYKITHHKNIVRKNKKWESIHSSYANSIGKLPYKGQTVNNVYAVGPHNIGSFTIVEHAVKSAIIFGNQEGFNTVYKVHSFNYLFILLTIIMSYITIYLVTNKM